MSEINQFFKGFDFKSDFVALSYREWQLEEAKKKPYRLVQRLKRRKLLSRSRSISNTTSIK